MMFAKPTSLPPIVMLTSVVAVDSVDNWLELRLVVVAPAHATEV